MGWWTRPSLVDEPVGGAISTAGVPSAGLTETEKYVKEFL